MTPPPRPEDARDALADAFVEQAPALIAWLRLRGASRSVDVEDIAQEAWLRALARMAEFDPERAAFRSWLFGIAANILLEQRRASARRARVQLHEGHTSRVARLEAVPDPVTSVTRRVARDEALETLLTALSARDPLDQKVFQLRGLEGRSHDAIARMLGISVATATKRWQRLREELAAHPLAAALCIAH